VKALMAPIAPAFTSALEARGVLTHENQLALEIQLGNLRRVRVAKVHDLRRAPFWRRCPTPQSKRCRNSLIVCQCSDVPIIGSGGSTISRRAAFTSQASGMVQKPDWLEPSAGAPDSSTSSRPIPFMDCFTYSAVS